MTPPLASIVLPVYNQAEHIGDVLREFVESLSRLGMGYELLPVVNGAGQDASWEACRVAATASATIRPLRIELGGWGRAVRAGLAQAHGEILCYTNSARTTGDDLRLVLQYACAHPEAAVKVQRKLRAGWSRRLGSLLYNLECRVLFDLPYWDINGTPKVFRRSRSRLLDLRHDGDLIDLEFMTICLSEGYLLLELPVFSTSRRSGESTTRIGSALKLYWGALEMWRRGRAR